MKYVIDEIIDDIAVLENLESKEKKEVSTSKLPKNIQEGNIVIEEAKYTLDLAEEKKRRSLIQEKLNKLKRGKYE